MLFCTPALVFVPALLLYPLFAFLATWPFRRSGRYSPIPFALVNVVASFALCVTATQAAFKANYPDAHTIKGAAISFGGYLALVLVNYWLLRNARRTGRGWSLAALWAPIALLIGIKYLPIYAMLSANHPLGVPNPAIAFVGLSYLSFRICYLVQEVQNEVVEMPDIWDYLSFAFFMPTMSVGPISPFRLFIGSLRSPDRAVTPVWRSVQRLIVGLAKYLFLSTLLSQLCYGSLLLDGHPHGRLDLVIAILVYPLYLYCNFSGLCDMVIGVAGLMGIEVMENFDRPFSSRNFQVFWSRWHISLSTFMRDMMFTPMVKYLAAKFGSKNISHAIAVTIVSVFVVIGIWHGAGLNFVLFGLSQGLGVAAVHYMTLFMKKRLGKKGFIAYQQNRLIHAAACICTYLYFALSMILFANSWEQLGKIARALA